MYIKKSVLSGIIMVIGVGILLAVALLFCFSEITVSRYIYLLVWFSCIWAVCALTGKVERS